MKTEEQIKSELELYKKDVECIRETMERIGTSDNQLKIYEAMVSILNWVLN